MNAPTIRHRQQLAAATLAHLLTFDLPLIRWGIDTTELIEVVTGNISSDGTPAERCAALDQWIAHLELPAPTWMPFGGREPGGAYGTRGVHSGVDFRIWTWLPAAPFQSRTSELVEQVAGSPA